MNVEMDFKGGLRLISIGMKRSDINRILGRPDQVFLKTPSDTISTDSYAQGFHVFYDSQDSCEAIEVFGDAIPHINGRKIAETKFSDLIPWLRELDETIEIDNAGVTSQKLNFGLYVPLAKIPHEAEVEALIIFREG